MTAGCQGFIDNFVQPSQCALEQPGLDVEGRHDLQDLVSRAAALNLMRRLAARSAARFAAAGSLKLRPRIIPTPFGLTQSG